MRPETATPSAPSSTVGDTEGGVIHDIGYRPYTGPRLGRGYIRRSLYVEGLRGVFGLGRSGRSKLMPMLLVAAMCLPAVVIVVATAATGADELVGSYNSYVLNLQLVIAIFVAGQSPVLVSRDLRFGVTSLYFSRPLERSDYVVAKFAAMTSAIFGFVALPISVLFIGALIAELSVGSQAPDAMRALGGALLLAPTLAGIGLVIASLTPRRGVGIAAVVTLLMVSIAVQSAVQGVAVVEGAEVLAGYAGLLSPFTLVDGVQSGLLGAQSILPASPPGVGGAALFGVLTVLLNVVCFSVLLLRYRKVSAL